MPEFFRKNFHLIFLFILSAAGIVLCTLATSKYGAGVAGDSIHYLSVAQNLLRGRGFIDYTDGPLILFPPLMSIILAGLAWVFKADVFIVGWILNIVLLGVNIFLSGLVLERIFPDRRVYFYISSMIVFTSASMLRMHASVLSDPLFFTMMLLFFLACEQYMCTRSWHHS
jgi:hypothetical protein